MPRAKPAPEKLPITFKHHVTSKEEERLIKLAADLSYKPTKKEYDELIQSDNPDVVIAWVKRRDITPTKAQYLRGSKYPDPRVRMEWYRWFWRTRPSWYKPPEEPKKLTPEEEFDRALKLLFSKKGKNVTPEVFEDYITHPDPQVRLYWALYAGVKIFGNKGLVATPQQNERGRNNSVTLGAWVIRSEVDKF